MPVVCKATLSAYKGFLLKPCSIKRYNIKSKWIIAKRYLGTLQNDLKNVENMLLLLLLEVSQIVMWSTIKVFYI